MELKLRLFALLLHPLTDEEFVEHEEPANNIAESEFELFPMIMLLNGSFKQEVHGDDKLEVDTQPLFCNRCCLCCCISSFGRRGDIEADEEPHEDEDEVVGGIRATFDEDDWWYKNWLLLYVGLQ